MDEEIKFERVYSTFSKSTVAFIKSLLESNSINYYIDNEHAASLALGEVTGVMTVMVTKNQVDLAKELLKEIKG